MVKEYAFFNSNIYVGNNETYDIIGKQYKILIKKCCKYSKVFSLNLTYGRPKEYEKLEHFEIHDNSYFRRIHNIANSNLKDAFCFGFEDSSQAVDAIRDGRLRFYKVCDDTCKLLIDMANSIFSWKLGAGNVNAENLLFYRSDGSELFCLTDGLCILNLRENEDFDDVILNDPWLYVDGWKVSYIDENLRSDKPVKFD